MSAPTHVPAIIIGADAPPTGIDAPGVRHADGPLGPFPLASAGKFWDADRIRAWWYERGLDAMTGALAGDGDAGREPDVFDEAVLRLTEAVEAVATGYLLPFALEGASGGFVMAALLFWQTVAHEDLTASPEQESEVLTRLESQVLAWTASEDLQPILMDAVHIGLGEAVEEIAARRAQRRPA